MAVPSGRVYLCRNAIVDGTQNHTITFKDPSEQLAYWGSFVKYTLTDFMYIRRSSQAIRVDKTLDELKDVNYMYFQSATDHKFYFCFITSKEYLSDNSSYIYFRTDVLQTYQFDYTVKPSYVVQEHTDRWDASHQPLYSRTDEGLDYGSEYTVESAYKIEPSLEGDVQFYLAICLPHNNLVKSGESTDPTLMNQVVLPYYYYLLPHDPKAGLTDNYLQFTFTTVGEPASEGVFAAGNLREFMNLMSDTELGNYVQQIVRLPHLPFKYKVGRLTNGSATSLFIDLSGNTGVEFTTTRIGSDSKQQTFLALNKLDKNYNFVQKLASMSVTEGIESAYPTSEQWAEVKAKPYTTPRDKRFESKLLCYPYRYNLFTDWRSAPEIIKNEYLGADKIQVNYTQGINFNCPARYWVEGYRKDPEGRGNSIHQALQEGVPVINDQYYTYMLNNKNQIQADIQNSHETKSMDMISRAFSLNLLGMARAGVEHDQLIRSQNALQKDIKNLPDTLLNTSDCGMSLFDNNEGVSLYRMKICCEFEELLADTWNLYGYQVKRVKVPNLKTRTRFNFVKTIGANIVGTFDQDDLNEIKSLFDRGITFWHYNASEFHPFDYSFENIERKLI